MRPNSFAAVLAVAGPALLALGISGLVPPATGMDAPSTTFRLVTIAWLLPGAWATAHAWRAFRRAWQEAEEGQPSREAIHHAYMVRFGESLLGQDRRIDAKRFWGNNLVGVSGLLQAVIGCLGLMIGLIIVSVALGGDEGAGELLTAVGAVVGSLWITLTGVRRFARRASPGWCMETKRAATSVQLHRRLETLMMCGAATTFIAVGQVLLVFDLAG